MYLYDAKAIAKLQENNAKFVVFSNGKSVIVKSKVFVPDANAKYVSDGASE